jgi:hypothetical protein
MCFPKIIILSLFKLGKIIYDDMTEKRGSQAIIAIVFLKSSDKILLFMQIFMKRGQP